MSLFSFHDTYFVVVVVLYAENMIITFFCNYIEECLQDRTFHSFLLVSVLPFSFFVLWKGSSKTIHFLCPLICYEICKKKFCQQPWQLRQCEGIQDKKVTFFMSLDKKSFRFSLHKKGKEISFIYLTWFFVYFPGNAGNFRIFIIGISLREWIWIEVVATGVSFSYLFESPTKKVRVTDITFLSFWSDAHFKSLNNVFNNGSKYSKEFLKNNQSSFEHMRLSFPFFAIISNFPPKLTPKAFAYLPELLILCFC